MQKRYLIPTIMLALLAAGPPGAAPQAAAGRVIGEVQSVGPAAIVVKTDAGETLTVRIDGQTAYLKLPPGQTTLEGAAAIGAADLAPGDRVLARGKAADDLTAVPARQVIVMSKADLRKKQDEERRRWQEHGISGVIQAINPEARQITLQARARDGVRTMTVAFTDATRVRRYAPDSVRFADAAPSSFAELQVGDQVRALGDKSADGERFTGEEVVAGAFQTVSGTVTAVSPDGKTIQIALLANRQPFSVTVTGDSKVCRISPQMTALLVQRSVDAGAQPTAAAAGRAADFQEMFEQLPPIAPADIKPGEIVLVSGTRGATPGAATAIALLTGLEGAINQIRARQAARARQAPNPNTGLPPGVLDFAIGLP